MKPSIADLLSVFFKKILGHIRKGFRQPIRIWLALIRTLRVHSNRISGHFKVKDEDPRYDSLSGSCKPSLRTLHHERDTFVCPMNDHTLLPPPRHSGSIMYSVDSEHEDRDGGDDTLSPENDITLVQRTDCQRAAEVNSPTSWTSSNTFIGNDYPPHAHRRLSEGQSSTGSDHIAINVEDDNGNCSNIEGQDDVSHVVAAPAAKEPRDEISPFIYPTMPSKVPRYARGRIVPDTAVTFTIQPRETSYVDPGLLPGWAKIVGPEGFPYFWHQEKRILTDNWIYDEEVYQVLSGFIVDVTEFLRTRHLHQTDDVHLVLDLCSVDPEDGGPEEWWCGYYFVDHREPLLFWQEEYCIDDFLGELRGDMTKSQIKSYLEYQYWVHWSLFPDVCRVTPKLFRMVENSFINAQTDLLTSDRSTVHQTQEYFETAMSMLQQSKESLLSDAADDALDESLCPWFIGRAMEILARNRVLNYYGQKCARVDAGLSVHGKPPSTTLSETSILFRFLSPLLFCAPDVHLKEMNALWVDRLTVLTPWRKFFNRLHDDWKGQLIYSSLLLTSNIAFLTVPNVTRENSKMEGTLVQIPSYMSTIASIGSIMLGLLLSRQHQNRNDTTATAIHAWLKQRCHSSRGLEPLAVMYSLPFALLMWGMVTFLASFTIMCLENTTISARVLVAFAWSATAALVAWFIYMSWEETDRWSSLVQHIIQGIRNRLLGIQTGDPEAGEGAVDASNPQVPNGLPHVNDVVSMSAFASQTSLTRAVSRPDDSRIGGDVPDADSIRSGVPYAQSVRSIASVASRKSQLSRASHRGSVISLKPR